MTFQLEKEFRSRMWTSSFKIQLYIWFRMNIKNKLSLLPCLPGLFFFFKSVSINSYLVAKEWFEVQKQLENRAIISVTFHSFWAYGDWTSFFPEAQRHCLLDCYANLYFGTKLELVLTSEMVEMNGVEAMIPRSCSFGTCQNLLNL